VSAILAILAEVWPFLLAAGGVIFGLFRHQQAKSTAAQAEQKVAEAETRAARNDAALAQANQAGAEAAAEAVKERTDVENETASLDHAALDERLRRWERD
jgi:hypothetical protein